MGGSGGVREIDTKKMMWQIGRFPKEFLPKMWGVVDVLASVLSRRGIPPFGTPPRGKEVPNGRVVTNGKTAPILHL